MRWNTTSEIKATHIKENESHHDAKVAPMMVVKDIKRESEELIRRAHAAELASGSGVGVRQVAAGSGDVSVHVPPRRSCQKEA